MFEDSTFASANRIHTRSSRYAAGSLFLQTSLLAILVLIPFLYPNALPPKFLSVSLIAPTPPPAAPVVEPQHAIASTSHTELLTSTIQAPSTIPTRIPHIVDSGPPGAIPSSAFANSGTNTLPLGPATPSVTPRVQTAKHTGPIHISQGVAAGQLIVPIQPRYPPIARATGTQGTVMVSAIISTDGRSESLRVLSGPPMLIPAAVDAIRQARYRPWTLNGAPVEVETTINVVFSLGND
ncbi:MAG TPA: energy transducer TonB [Acidobacteriaceae bacterium]|nr:energy transducer TonB [Acidobacteriaceae bacterium]